MRLNEKNAESLAENLAEKRSEGLSVGEGLGSKLLASALVDRRSYHELEPSPVMEMDTLVQLKTNLEILADLTSRLTFLNREIRYVMKVD